MKKNKITPFIESFKSGKTIDVNGKKVNFALYNAIISKRDLGLWKAGMKPHRHWKVTNVKKFFGFTGNNKEKLCNDISNLVEDYSNINMSKIATFNAESIEKDIKLINHSVLCYQITQDKDIFNSCEETLLKMHDKYGTVETEIISLLTETP
jgi:hypothetical protein